MKSPSEFNGFVIIDKPAGMTSHDVVAIARRLYRTKRVGHTGTLDPDATGVLVLCLGQATRLAEYLSAARKHYRTDVVFGIETDTQDASGEVIAERDASHLAEADVRVVLSGFRGTIQQVPPMVSALHHNGQRLYELARAGVTVEREPREIQIDQLELTHFEPGAHPTATLEITCSTGTYIRTLAADLGGAVGVGGMMRALRRSWVGDNDRQFALETAYTIDRLRELADSGSLRDTVLPPGVALATWPTIRLEPAELDRIRHGQFLSCEEIACERQSGWSDAEAGSLMALLDETGDMVAVARRSSGQIKPIKVFAS